LLPAEKLIDGHARLLTFDIPERLVNAADSVVQDRAISPIGGVVHGLPQIFDRVGRTAHEKGLQIAVDRRDYQIRPLRERRAAIPV